MRYIAIASMLLCLSGSALAQQHEVSSQDALKIMQWRLSMPAPSSDGQAWHQDMITFAALSCARHANLEPLPDFSRLKLHKKSGSFRAISDPPSGCASLATRPTLQCTQVVSRQFPFIYPPSGLPSSYLYINSEKDVADNAHILVSASCSLARGVVQTYVGTAVFNWTRRPVPLTINISNESKRFIAGGATLHAKDIAKSNVMVLQAPFN